MAISNYHTDDRATKKYRRMPKEVDFFGTPADICGGEIDGYASHLSVLLRKITRSVNVPDEISIGTLLTVGHQFEVLKDLRMLVTETVKAPAATVR